MTIRNQANFFGMMHLRSQLAITVLIGILAGCTPDPNAAFQVYPINGTVSWKDGRPLPDRMSITLQSIDQNNVQAIGTVKSDGSIADVMFLGFGGDGRPGMIAGKHKVVLKVPIPNAEEMVNFTPTQRQQNLAQARMFEPYGTAQKTPLIVEVGPDQQELTIVLDGPATKAK